MNLRIDSEETRRRGAETHVCEVQLLLRAFADIKVGLLPCIGVTTHPCPLSDVNLGHLTHA